MNRTGNGCDPVVMLVIGYRIAPGRAHGSPELVIRITVDTPARLLAISEHQLGMMYILKQSELQKLGLILAKVAAFKSGN